MATKHTDGCFQHAEDDEPLFTLLARDASAPSLVALWADLREKRDGLTLQVREARLCAEQMREWRMDNRSPAPDLFAGPTGKGDPLTPQDLTRLEALWCGDRETDDLREVFRLAGVGLGVSELPVWTRTPPSEQGLTGITSEGAPLPVGS